MTICFHLKSLAALAPNRRVGLFLEALKPSIDLSCDESPKWHFLAVEDCIIYIEYLLFSVVTFINYHS